MPPFLILTTTGILCLYNIFMKKKAFPIFLVVFYIVWFIRATWFYSHVDADIPSETWQLAFSIFIKFILWVLPAAAFIYWMDGENPLKR